MKTMMQWLRDSRPFFKIIILLQLLVLSIFGPILSVLVIAFVLFLYSIKIKRETEYIASPLLILIFCALATIIVIPGGSADEILRATDISIRLAAFMFSANVFVVILSPFDFIEVWKRLRLPPITLYPFLVAARFIPISIRNMHSVLIAQKSRGFHFNLKKIFLLETWMVLVIPYLITLLRIANNNWISMSLRNFSYVSLVSDEKKKFLSLSEGLIILATFVLWIIPETNLSILMN